MTAVKATGDTSLADVYADKIRPLLPKARTAFGSQPPGSPPRVASDRVNDLVLEYFESGSKMPALADALDGEISLSGLRRRVRLARATKRAGKKQGELGRTKRPRGSTDPELVSSAAAQIAEGRARGGKAYGDAVRSAYNQGIALQPIADELGISYFALWSAKRSAY